MTKPGMQNISLRAATSDDEAFAPHVMEACMRVYAEQTWGSWNGRADLDLAFDKIIRLAGRGIGMIGSIAARIAGSLTSFTCCRPTKTTALVAIYCDA